MVEITKYFYWCKMKRLFPQLAFMTRHPVNLCDDVNESQSSFFVDLCVPASDLATQIIWERNESTQVELTTILFDV